MADQEYVVPEGMRKAAMEATNGWDPEGYFIYLPLLAALKWLAENPIVPTPEQVQDIRADCPNVATPDAWQWGMTEWQRRMLLKPKVKVRAPNDIIHAFRGRSFTQEQADEIKAITQQCVRPEKGPNKDSRRRIILDQVDIALKAWQEFCKE
jgi:hypothetical protein